MHFRFQQAFQQTALLTNQTNPTTFFFIFFFLVISSPAIKSTMATRRTGRTEFVISAPPPSPIPTARGSRSAANDTLSKYLDTSLNVPDLSLPEPHLPLNAAIQIPEEIDYRLLEFGDYATIERLLRSAGEFGAFRISCRGIFVADLRSLFNEADRIFRSLQQVDVGVWGNLYKQDIEQIVWLRFGSARDYLAQKYLRFCATMDSIETKLEEIAELLGKIFVENIARMQFGKRLRGKESIFSLYKYNQNYCMEHNPFPPMEENRKNCDYTLCLHLPAMRSQFLVRSASGLLAFEGGPDTIVVIVGHRVEEWSMGDFKCACRQVIYEPLLQGGLSSFSLELKCLSLNFEPNFNKNRKTISVRDQILIMLFIAYLYKIFVFLCL